MNRTKGILSVLLPNSATFMHYLMSNSNSCGRTIFQVKYILAGTKSFRYTQLCAAYNFLPVLVCVLPIISLKFIILMQLSLDPSVFTVLLWHELC